MTGTLEDANEKLRAAIENGDPVAQVERIRRAFVDNAIMHGPDPMPSFVTPYLLSISDREWLANATEQLMWALEQACQRCLDGEDDEDLIEVDEHFYELLDTPTGYDRIQCNVRLDVFYDPAARSLQLLEYNCGSPSGTALLQKVRNVFEDGGLLEPLRSSFQITSDSLVDEYFRAGADMLHRWCRAYDRPFPQRPFVVCTASADSEIVSDMQALAELSPDSLDVSYAPVDAFRYEGGSLLCEGRSVDLVCRDYFEDLMGSNRSILQAFEDQNVCMINPPLSTIGDNKSILEFMTSARYRHWFGDAWESLQRWVPWTRLMRDTETDLRGQNINLIEYVLQNRTNLVLKPSRSYGGRGVLIGASQNEENWSGLIDELLEGDQQFVVQHAVTPPTQLFPSVVDGEWRGFEPRYLNLNLWSYGGKFGGAFCRAAQTPIINIHAGGGLLPVFYLSE